MQPFVVFPAPDLPYLSLQELARWLGLDKREIRRLIADGKIPDGQIRAGRKFSQWSREDAAGIKWTLDNLSRFSVGVKSGKVGESRT